MMTAGILAKETGISLFTVRFYTRIGLLKPSRNPQNGYKVYQASDRARLRFIVAAKIAGFTLGEIAGILDRANYGNLPCSGVRETIERRLEENRRNIKQMKKMQSKMENTLKEWNKMKGAVPNGDSVRQLIELMVEVNNAAKS